MSRETLILLLVVTCGLWVTAQAHDPTAPPAGFSNDREAPAEAPRADATGFTVTYVMLGVDRRLALVNGALVAEGDRVNGARVTEIRSDSVTLVVGEQRLRLPVADKSIRKRNIRVENP